jgi:hypothetical protein
LESSLSTVAFFRRSRFVASRFTMSKAGPAAAGEAAPPYALPEVPTTIEIPAALRARLELLAAPLAADADQNVVSPWMEPAREVITSI